MSTRILLLAPLPPSRSPAAADGEALRRLVKRLAPGRRGVRAPWPVPENVEALIRGSDLPVYLLSNDPGEREIYQAAVEHPGLVVLPDLALDRVIEELVQAREPVGMAARREAQELARRLDIPTPWCAQAVRRARGLVVHRDEDRRFLERLGCRTPVFVPPPPRAARPEDYREAVTATLRMLRDPAEWSLARWAAALSDSGVTAAELDQGYGLRYAEALEEIRSSAPGGS
jgi:hypothetical protein